MLLVWIICQIPNDYIDKFFLAIKESYKCLANLEKLGSNIMDNFRLDDVVLEKWNAIICDKVPQNLRNNQSSRYHFILQIFELI